jgi:hypothetical protein
MSVSVTPLCFNGGAYPWGLVLVDIARHVARAFENEGVETYRQTMMKIRAMFDKEWDFPTDHGTTQKLETQ